MERLLGNGVGDMGFHVVCSSVVAQVLSVFVRSNPRTRL